MPTNSSSDASDDSRQQKRAELDKLIEQGEAMRSEMDEKLETKKEQHATEDSARKQRAQEGALEEQAQIVQRKEDMVEWRENEKKRKAAVLKMKKEHEAEIALLEEKKAAKKKAAEEHKEYMEDLDKRNQMIIHNRNLENEGRLEKEKEFIKAKAFTEQEKKNVEQDFKKQKDQIEKETRKKRGKIEEEAKQKVDMLEIEKKEKLKKILTLEKNEMSTLEARLRSNRAQRLGRIADPVLLKREEQTLDREERKEREKIEKKFTKQKSDLEVEMKKAAEHIRRKAKTEGDKTTYKGRDDERMLRLHTNRERQEVDAKAAEMRQEARRLEQRIASGSKERQDKEDERMGRKKKGKK